MPENEDFIETLIHDLSQETFEGDDVYNEYAPDNPYNATRRDNLRLYLQEMLIRKPEYMLIMEAPGYRGCRLTGVPVTSRKILIEGLSGLEMFGKERGYHLTEDEGFENVYGEQSATIVWNTLLDIGVVPFIWNTFPFHPRKGDNQRTNRKPRVPETELGAIYLHRVIDFFKPGIIIAAGNVAHNTLTKNAIDCHKVRHPAQGGKNDFVAGINNIIRAKS